MSVTTCTANIANLSRTACKSKYGQIIGFWFDRTATGVTLANSLIEATWTAKVNAASASRMIVLYPAKPMEVVRNLEEELVTRGNTGKQVKIRDGYIDFTASYENLSLCVAQKLKTLDGLSLYSYFITENETIIAGGTSTQLQPVPVNVFVSDPIPQENNDTLWMVNVKISLENTTGNFVNASTPTAFTPTELNGIIDFDITVVSSDVSDNEVIFTVEKDCSEGDLDGAVFSTAGDFVVELVSSGVLRTVTAVSASGNQITLTVTDLTAAPHYIYFKDANAATVKGYETPDTVQFTPVA